MPREAADHVPASETGRGNAAPSTLVPAAGGSGGQASPRADTGAGEDLLQWPPPDSEIDRVEAVSLGTVPPLGASSLPELGSGEPAPAPRELHEAGGDRRDEPSSRAALVGWMRPAEPVAIDRREAGPPDRSPASLLEDESDTHLAPAPPLTRRGPVHERVRASVPWWVVPAIALSCVGGLAAGWFLRPVVFPTPPIANLTVETNPPGAEVSIDGTVRGQAPLRLALPAGTSRLAVTAGGVTRDVQLQLGAGTEIVRSFDFVPASGTPAGDASLGSLQVDSRPPGAQVVIAGQARGVTPLTVSGLAPGTLEVQLVTADRTLAQQVEIRAGTQAMLVVPMSSNAAAPGWIAVRSPVPLRILEGGRVVGTTDSDRIMLAGGRHDLEFVNEGLEVRIPRSVAVQGGRETALDVSLPRGLVSINARPWAEVFAQGNRLGETPLGSVSLPVGEQELVFRHPQFGERRQSVTVRAVTPARVSVAFTP
jgi:hypothetical protein